MNQMAINYGKVLFLLDIDREMIAETAKIWNSSKPLQEVLESPVVQRSKKHSLIEKIFPETLHSFLKVVCDNHEEKMLPDIFRAYQRWYDDSRKIKTGILYYVAILKESISGFFL